MTLKYVQEHTRKYDHSATKAKEELHLENGELFQGDHSTGFTVKEEGFSPRNFALGLVAVAVFFVTDRLHLNL